LQAWKPLLIVLPAGLMLGAIGGHYSRPVMTDPADESSQQSAFRSRAERNGSSGMQAQPADAEYYAGGYSYPPYLDDRMLGGDREITGWQGPSFADWPEYQPAATPSSAQVEAQLAARDAALGRRAWDSFGTGDEQTAAEAAADAAADAAANAADGYRSGTFGGDGSANGPKAATLPPSSGSTTSREPRTPDGNLPAIW
jgi:hypothetical protein